MERERPVVEVVPGSCPPPSPTKGRVALESIPCQPAESCILHHLLSGCLMLLLCRSTLSWPPQLPDLTRFTPGSTDVLHSHPLVVPRFGCYKTFSPSHGAGPKTQDSKACGSKGSWIFLSLGKSGQENDVFFTLRKGFCFSRGWR